MSTTIQISRFIFEIIPHGDLSAFAQWAGAKRSYQTALDGNDTVKIRLSVDLDAHWINGNIRSNLIDYSNGEVQSVQFDKPNLSGRIERNADSWAGSFKVNVHNLKSMDFAIATCLSVVGVQYGMLLIHSSAVVVNDKAWLFVGDSGAGKTTIATELKGGGQTMAVDKTLLSVSENGVVTAHSTPFSDMNGVSVGPCFYDVGGLVFIEKSDSHQVCSVDPFDAMRMMLLQAVMVLSNKQTIPLFMTLFGGLVDHNVPAYYLKFKKNDAFWSLLTDQKGI